LWTLLVLSLLHRPILHIAIRQVAVRVAKSMHMDMNLRVGGSIWTALRLTEVSVHGDSAAGAPVERLTLDRVDLRYSLWSAIRGDFSHVLRNLEVGRLDGVVALQKTERREPKERSPVADTFRELLSNSLSPVEHFSIERVDLEVKHVASVQGLCVEAGGGKPGFIAWDRIHIAGLPEIAAVRATFLLADSRIDLGRLRLIPGVEIERLAVDRVTSRLPHGGLELALKIGGGTASVRVEPATSRADLTASVEVESVDVTEAATPLGTKPPAAFVLDRFTAKFTGAPEKLDGANASVSFEAHGGGAGGIPAFAARGDAALREGTLRITDLTVSPPGVQARISGTVLVPVKDFALEHISGQIDWRLLAPDLAAVKLDGVPALGGVANGSGQLRLGGGEAQIEGILELSRFVAEKLRVESAEVRISGMRKLDNFADILATLTVTASLDAKGIAAGGVKVDSAIVQAKATGRSASIESLKVALGDNAITGSAKAALQAGGAGFDGPPEIDLTVNAPRLEQFGIAVNGAALSGSVTAGSRLRVEGARLSGRLSVTGSDFRLGGVPAGGVSAEVTFAQGSAVLDALHVMLADAGEITAKGRVGLNSAMPYSGELSVRIRDLAKLQVLAAAAGYSAEPGGTLNLDWSCSGEVQTMKHEGRLQLDGRTLRHAGVRLDEMQLGVDYAPGSVATRELRVVAGKVCVLGQVSWRESRLSLAGLSVALAGDEILRGEATVPFVSESPRGPLPDDQPLTARLRMKNADIAKLAGSFGVTPQVTGNVSMDATVDGTLAKPVGAVNVSLVGVKSAKAQALAPADADIRLNVSDAKAVLAAVIRQRDIKPLTVNASAPLDIAKLRTDPGSVRTLPIEASVKLPASSLAFVPRLVPAVAKLDGTVAANVEVRGTVDAPRLDGEVVLQAKSLRMANRTLPPVSNFASKISFTGDAATLREFRGETGGGSFNLAGGVKLAGAAPPVFDLRLRSDKVLVLREESITVRADTDVALAGRLNSARVSGTVFVTQGRFTKDVDLLPLSLPGRPRPQARVVAPPRKVSFPDPPLRDWKFDVAIKTREKDPFLVRGNVARGSVSLDLRLGGSGLDPFLTGSARIDEFRAELPASRLEITRGLVTFAQDEPFEPRLDIQGLTRVGRTTVNVAVSGPSSAPKLELDSEPPLPEREILALLATGATTSEIGSNTAALASKAALLTVKRWWRKTVKRDEPAGDDAPSPLDRFELDVGSVDPRTGRPDVTGTFRISDQLFFLGEIDMQGQTIGRVKYLLRFR
jgi:hypothetical protein